MKDISKSFKQLDLIFIAILSTQILLALLFYVLRDTGAIELTLLQFEYLPILILIVNTCSILLAKYLFTARNKIDKKLNIEKKFLKYYKQSIVIISVLEFTNMINIAIYFITGLQVYLLVAVLVLILYIVYRPSKIKFAGASLTGEEKQKLFSEQSA